MGDKIMEKKFRTWDKIYNEWVDNNDIVINQEGLLFIRYENQVEFQPMSLTKSANYEIVFFTGLKDKNGKEIYEGDILTWFADGINKKAIVIWKDCGWCAKRIDKKLNKFEKFYQFSHFIPVEINKEGKKDLFDGEVIGNKFENPELLEGQ